MDRVCPLLGLVGDRRSVIDGVDAGHRCHAESPPQPLSRQEQAQLCLTAAHPRCERYLRHVATASGGVPGKLPIGDGLVSTRMVLTPTPAWRGIAGRARRAPRGPVVLGAGAALILGAAGIAVASGVMDPADDGAPSASAAASAGSAPTAWETSTAPPSPSASPTAEATASPTEEPTPGPTAVPTPAPTAAPTPTPPPAQTTYVVQGGDTLAAIAQRFGTTVAALQAANGIEDPNEIIVGQVLVIP